MTLINSGCPLLHVHLASCFRSLLSPSHRACILFIYFIICLFNHLRIYLFFIFKTVIFTIGSFLSDRTQKNVLCFMPGLFNFFILYKFMAPDFNIKCNAYTEKMLDVKNNLMRFITLMCRTFKLKVFWIHFGSFSSTIN